MQKHKQSFGKKDAVLLAVLLAAGGLIFWLVTAFSGGGGTVVVRVDGKQVMELPLAEDREYTIEGVAGGTNRLVIRGGEAWVEEASCPDGLCMGMGRISRTGQSIICLPNRVVVEIRGSAANEVDEIVK